MNVFSRYVMDAYINYIVIQINKRYTMNMTIVVGTAVGCDRAIVRGIYGMKHFKWPSKIELVNYDFKGSDFVCWRIAGPDETKRNNLLHNGWKML